MNSYRSPPPLLFFPFFSVMIVTTPYHIFLSRPSSVTPLFEPLRPPTVMPDRAKCYRYTQQLLVLERCTETGIPAGLELKHVETSLRVVKWEVLLASHPDREIVEYLLRGIRQGFRIGFDREKCRLRSRTQNMSSANERPEIVSKYTAHEQV